MPSAYVGIGSNDDPERALPFAVAELARQFGRVRVAAAYRSAAAGPSAPDYVNSVVAFETALRPEDVRRRLQAIEAAAGRRRDDPAVCRLDLDLLLYGARVDAAERLPRAGIARTPFVLAPLAELAPAGRHPLTGEPFGRAWTRLAVAAGPLARLGDVAVL